MLTPQKDLTKPCCVFLEPITPKQDLNFSAELKKVINERNILTAKTRRCVNQALDQIQEENDLSNQQKKKEHVLGEILTSEEAYVDKLRVIIQFFIKPCKERGLLKPHDFDVMFGSISSIYEINRKLLTELKKGSDHIAEAFSKFAPFFKSYSFYAFEFKNTLEIIKNAKKDNPEFHKFLERQETRPEVQSKLSALLIAPIQRVPRYKLLLHNLLECTSREENDYSSLEDSQEKVKNAADHINKVIKDRENMQRLIEFQRCLQDRDPNIIMPGRNLIKEGVVRRMPQETNSYRIKIYLVLTNDILIFCKLKKGTAAMKCKNIFPLNKCKVEEILDKGAFRVSCEEEEIVLFHDSLSETEGWIQDIKKAIKTHLEDRKTLRKDSLPRRPVKRKDLGEYNEVGISPGTKLRKKEVKHGNVPLLSRKPIRPTSPVNQTVSHEKLVEKEPMGFDNGVSKDLFVFGRPNPDPGFPFKMNQWICGIGSSVKKFLGFK